MERERRGTRRAVIAALVALTVAAPGLIPAAAQTPPAPADVPPSTAPPPTSGPSAGATGAPGDFPGTGRVAEADEIVTMATTVRAFGRQPFADVTAAAASRAASARTGGCGLSDAKLAAIMLAITFTEAGPLASSTVAPSPMTLSRWDGSAVLYAFGNRSTPYRTAFWHPGIGLWQFDHPWSNTAAERIDTSTAAVLAAQVVAGRFCSWTAATGLTRLAYTVAPWHGCDDPRGDGERCREIFLEHFRDNSPSRLDDDTLVQFTLVDGVGRLGGATRRTCQFVGDTSTRPCLYVDPAAAQGNRAWTSPAFSPNPLSSPFYVVRDGQSERRFWLSADTGYAIDIDASAAVGSNPRTTLRWSSGPKLCDRTTLRGACDLRAPPWKDWQLTQVTGTYRPLTGDFDGDGRTDIFWYAPGAAADSIWFARGTLDFARVTRPVRGTYTPVTGDFDGDGRTDIIWYAPGTGADSLWSSNGDGSFTPRVLALDGVYRPLTGDFDGDGRTEVFWYTPGSPAASPDRFWQLRADGSVAVTALPVAGSYRTLVGDLDGDGRDDLFLYGPGTYPDHLWFGSTSGFDRTATSVRGTYEPLVGDFDGNAVDDIFWYAPGSAPDSVWYGATTRRFASVAHPVRGDYTPVVGDLSGDGPADIVWYARGAAADSTWRGTTSRGFVSDGTTLTNTYVPLVGQIDGTPGDDVFWYRAGPDRDGIWFD